MATPAPDLHIPASSNTVHVQIIDTTAHIDGIALAPFVEPSIPGFSTLSCPVFSFLIAHGSRKVLFDLGVRPDLENLAPRIRSRISDWPVKVKKGVRQQLEENGVDGESIEAIVWSHWHWDHTGDPSTFPSSTALVVGPGFKENFVPGYPINQNSPILESDYAGRELKEITFEASDLKIGRFNAFDYFGDGSFYLLDSPGHAIGHLCGLARVSPDAFIFMGGDAAHHGGEFRPSEYLPFPSSISPHPLNIHSPTPCPGHIFEDLLRDGDKTQPFYRVANPKDGRGVAHDAEQTQETIGKMMEADANDKILVALAHDDTLLDVVDFFPAYADGFVEKGWVAKSRWRFLKDFASAVDGK